MLYYRWICRLFFWFCGFPLTQSDLMLCQSTWWWRKWLFHNVPRTLLSSVIYIHFLFSVVMAKYKGQSVSWYTDHHWAGPRSVRPDCPKICYRVRSVTRGLQYLHPFYTLTQYFKIHFLTCISVCRDSSVGIATSYGLGGPVIESRCGRDFPHRP